MAEDLHRWCESCSAYNLRVKVRRSDSDFYGCIKFPGCKQTETVKHRVDVDPVDVDRELEEEQLRLAKSKIKGREELEAMAIRYGVPGPAAILEDMRKEIPGFGKKYEDLTDEERGIRAQYFLKATGGRTIGQQLPYDKDEQQS